MTAEPPSPFFILCGVGTAGGCTKERRLGRHHFRLVPQLLCSDADSELGSKGLILPGSFGRLELLRPFLSSSCRACCSVNSGGGGVGGANKKDCIGIIGNNCDNEEVVGGNKCTVNPSEHRQQRRICCETCLSIKSMAKFIPRTNFLNFTLNEDSTSEKKDVDLNNGGRRKRKFINNANERVRLTISGLNASRLVHIASTTPSTTKSSSSPPSSQEVELNDGDVISLLWHRNGQNNYDSATGRCGNDARNEYPSSSATLEPLIQYRFVKIEEDTTDLETFEHYDGSSSLLGCEANEDDEEPTRSTKKDGVARSKTMSHGIHNDAINMAIDQHCKRLEREDVIEDAEKSSCNNCTKGIVDEDEKEDEEEDESAPLSLPSRFLASYSNSFSFNSMEKSSLSQPSNNAAIAIDVDADYTSLNSGTISSKDVGLRETTTEDVPLLESRGETMITPKKTNVTKVREMISVPITSLSYDQLVQLHEETTHPIFSAKPSASPSIRHTVLSLTLALTSNVSSYQTNFMRKTNANVNTHGGTSVDTVEQQILPRHWMPRLLLGTHVNIPKNTGST